MLYKIDHIGIAVDKLNNYMSLFENILGLEYLGAENVIDQNVNVAFFKIGDTKIELLESTCPEGPIARHISSRGQGVQHIAFCVPNIEIAIEEMRIRGVIMIDEIHRVGINGAKIAFLHPKSTNGILIELCEQK